MRVLSVNVGRPQLQIHGGRTYSTSINRRATTGSMELTPAGFDGDRVSDSGSHGGGDKAVCCYPHEHYAEWGRRLGRALAVPSFGENLTTEGLLEEACCIGDTYRIGTATVQISQPRQPCWKLANKHDEQRLPAWINERHWTGFYFRVLTPGCIRAGDEVALVERPLPQWTVARVNAVHVDKHAGAAAVAQLAEMAELSESWRRYMRRRLRPGAEELED